MKKFASLILALAMVFSLCISANAAEPEVITDVTAGSNTSDSNVEITFTENPTGTVYRVTVQWNSLAFSYVKASQGSWDPDTHTYINTTASTWVDTDPDAATVDVIADGGSTITRNNAITVTNHSNAAISATPTFEKRAGSTNTNVTATLNRTSGSATLARADEGASLGNVANAPFSTYSLQLAGAPTATEINSTPFGTITVTITAAP